MNRRYLEIDSTYRNRQCYKLPSDFEVLISQTGDKNRITALDPVSLSAPLELWVPSDFEVALASVQANPANTAEKFLVNAPLDTFERTLDYYVGQPITIGSNNTLISSWEFSSSGPPFPGPPPPPTKDYFWVTVNPVLQNIPGAIAVDFKTSTNLKIGIIYIPDSVRARAFYTECIIWNDTKQEGVTIDTYDGTTHTAGVDATVTGTWDLTDTLILRKNTPLFIGDSKLDGGTVTQVTLPPQASSVDDFYTGSFIRITSDPANNNPNFISRIVAYDGATKIANLGNALSVTAKVDDIFEILMFSYDNFSPFNYTGSTVSQQEMVCYEIELVNLVLPNIELVTGGKIAFYPYVYVELQNVSGAGAGIKNVIYSNNPNATRRLFRAAIDDISNPLLAPFIKIDGDGMIQTVKFKPNDNLKFGVYLPNGENFETVVQDSVSPAIPNPLVQVSALFSLKRL